MLTNVPFSLNEVLVNCQEEPSGIGQFFRLELHRVANWPSFGQIIETGRISPCFDLVSINKSKQGRLAIRWNFEPEKSTNLTSFLPRIDQ